MLYVSIVIYEKYCFLAMASILELEGLGAVPKSVTDFQHSQSVSQCSAVSVARFLMVP